MGAALSGSPWKPEEFAPESREHLADEIVREQGRVVVAALAFSARTFFAPIWEMGREDGVVEGELRDVVGQIVGETEASRAAEENPGPIRRRDLDRVQKHIRSNGREASIDLQSKTLEEPFLQAAGEAMRTAAREKWGKDRFLAEIDRLADEYGTAGFRGSYAATWHRTAVVNQSWNNGVLLMFGREPTRRLYPYLILYTMEDDRVRDNHFALNRFVARSTWEGWQRFAPPLGWNCRCRLAPVAYVVAEASGWQDDFPNGDPGPGAGRDAGFSLPLVTLPLRRAA